MATGNWYITSDTRILIEGLYDNNAGSYVNSGTVTGQLTDWTDTNVGSAITFSYIAASNGNWSSILPDTVTLTEDREYTLTITATATSGAKLTVKLKRKAAYSEA